MDLKIAMWVVTGTLLAMFITGKARRTGAEEDPVYQLLMSWLVILVAVTAVVAIVVTVGGES